MAKKKKQLPDLSKQDILTPIDVSTLGINGDCPLPSLPITNII